MSFTVLGESPSDLAMNVPSVRGIAISVEVVTISGEMQAGKVGTTLWEHLQPKERQRSKREGSRQLLRTRKIPPLIDCERPLFEP